MLLDKKVFRDFVADVFPKAPAPAKRAVDHTVVTRTMHKDLKKRIKRLRNDVRTK
jgi:hypothetical protein